MHPVLSQVCGITWKGFDQSPDIKSLLVVEHARLIDKFTGNMKENYCLALLRPRSFYTHGATDIMGPSY